MHNSGLSIWFFIGVLLTIYGAMIFGYGCYEWSTDLWRTSNVILADLHAPVWWGGLLLALGLFYGVRFRPSRNG
ncbi:MAG: hypothetical protein ABR976_06025 [Terracidiphilus sp.]|jgi:hypothetical protein